MPSRDVPRQTLKTPSKWPSSHFCIRTLTGGNYSFVLLRAIGNFFSAGRSLPRAARPACLRTVVYRPSAQFSGDRESVRERLGRCAPGSPCYRRGHEYLKRKAGPHVPGVWLAPARWKKEAFTCVKTFARFRPLSLGRMVHSPASETGDVQDKCEQNDFDRWGGRGGLKCEAFRKLLYPSYPSFW
jgi:hypothetical protein